MKKFLILCLMFIICFFTLLTYKTQAEELKPLPIKKASQEVSDASYTTYSVLYMQYIPANLRISFEADRGTILVTSVIDGELKGWKQGIATGKTTIIKAIPTIYVSDDIVDNGKKFKPNTSRKVLTHEFGHYVHAKSNKLRYGKFSYNISEEFILAYNAEGKIIAPEMSEALKDSFKNAADIDEFYCNVFSGICTEPELMLKYYPLSTTAILKDINLISESVQKPSL